MTIAIPCPKCGKLLRIPDASLLGKIGRCPKCEHKFVLEEPDEVPLELVQTPSSIPQAGSSKPLKVGVAAEWVPDEAPPAGVFGSSPVPAFDSVANSTPRSKKTKKKRSPAQSIAVIGLFVIVAVGLAFFLKPYLLPPAGTTVAANSGKKANKKSKPVESEATPVEEEAVAAETEQKFGRPTNGKPIDLLWIPSGARIVINMRPAEIWKAGGKGPGEFVAALGPIQKWMEANMLEFLKAKPEEIEELLLCIIPGQRGSPPDFAAVVRRTKDHKFKKSDLIEGMTPTEVNSKKYYTNEKWAMAFQTDLQTYSIAPVSVASEMVGADEKPNDTATELEELLEFTDRSLHFTIVCIPTDLNIHGEVLVRPDVQALLENIRLWISSNDEVEAAAWSFHLSEDKFYSQIMLRNRPLVSPRVLSKTFQTQLEGTPRQVLELVQMMDPKKVGPRRVIGRFPAMMKVVQLGTRFQNDKQLVSMIYEGPERAAPNLALGALLAWDESTRTNFSSSAAAGTGTVAQTRKPLTELLKTKIDVDFRREPLENAFNFIAGEAKFDIYVDGDGLKTAGYTKNMPQIFKLEGVAASTALAKIQSAYPAMCFVIDESKNLVTVTVLDKAKAQNQKVIVFK